MMLKSHAAKGQSLTLGTCGPELDLLNRKTGTNEGLMTTSIRVGPDQELFRLAIEAAPTGMLMVNKDGRITLINEQIEKLFGYERSELINQPLEILVPQRFKARHPGFRDSFFTNPQT